MEIINKTVTSIVEGWQPQKKISPVPGLETYDKTTIFIPVDITEDVVELVAQNSSGALGPGSTDSEALQG